MFDHVTIRVSDREASERFYETVLRTLGIEQTHSDEHLAEWNDFSLAAANDEKPVTRRLHVAFGAPSRGHVNDFWHAGTDAGYADDGPSGLRPEYSAEYYGAFLLDPAGNSAEAVHHGTSRKGIDHLWIRVTDVAASKRFYETIARYAGIRLGHDKPDRAGFAGDDGSFSLVAGPPSEHVHLAFAAGSNATVDDFHRAALSAGYPDNGPPGERTVYHAGYYSAYVLDPDGNNVEVVNHNR